MYGTTLDSNQMQYILNANFSKHSIVKQPKTCLSGKLSCDHALMAKGNGNCREAQLVLKIGSTVTMI